LIYVGAYEPKEIFHHRSYTIHLLF